MAQSPKSKEVLETPQSSIGAQDLLQVCTVSKQGFLRKQGQLERTFKFLKWRQRFVILSRGCIYIFNDELSSSPLKSLSMRDFKKCKRSQETSSMRWAFELVPETSTNKVISFACTGDTMRRAWMRACVDEIMKAKDVVSKNSLRDIAPGDNDEYVYLEREVRTPPPPVPGRTEDSSGEEGSDEGSDINGEYQRIDETKLSQSLAREAVKSTPASKNNAKPTVVLQKPVIGKSKPKPATPPDSPTNSEPGQPGPRYSDVKRESFQYEGKDRDEIKDLLTARPEGTYLVRKSRNDNREVLSVNIEGNLKEYKIYSRDSGYTINNKDHFSGVEELLAHYTTSILPNKTAKLYRAYSLTDPSYVN